MMFLPFPFPFPFPFLFLFPVPRGVRAPAPASVPRQRGFSLIVAMVMLAVIGLASAAIMRNATGAGQLAASHRLRTQAGQFAQVALRFCENQLTLASSRPGASMPPQCLVEATAVADVFTVTARGFSPDFTSDAGTGAIRSGSVVWLQSTILLGALAAAIPNPAPVAASSASSADVAACDGACAASIRQRVWQQLLTPPF
jgi:type II secretory pathway pseudopilin PulG